MTDAPSHTSSPRVAAALTGVAALLGTVAGCSSAAPTPGAPATSAAAVATTSTTSPLPSTTSPTTELEPVDAAFVKKAEPVCTDWVKGAQGHQYAGEGGPRAATTADLPMAAAYLDAQPLTHEGQTKLTALGAPSKGAASWTVVVADVAKYQAAAGRAIAAARSGQVPAWQTAFDQLYSAIDTVHHDLVDVGFPASGSCVLLFVQGGGH